jgi:hypothetical protein
MKKILATLAAGLVAYGAAPALMLPGSSQTDRAEARGGGGGGGGGGGRGGGGFGGGGGYGGGGGGFGGGYGGGFHGGGAPPPLYGSGGRGPSAGTLPARPPSTARPPSASRPPAGQRPGAKPTPPIANAPGAVSKPPGAGNRPPEAGSRPPGGGNKPPNAGNRPPLAPGARPPGWRPPGSRPPGWRPPAARPPYARPPHWQWGNYNWYPAWGWYFTGVVAGATLAFVDTLPAGVDCATSGYQGESLYQCGDVLYRATYYEDERVYEIVSDATRSGGGSPPAASGPLRLMTPRLRGGEVSALQQALIREGIALNADGVFGPATDRALRDYQAQNGLDATGALDEATAAKLGL